MPAVKLVTSKVRFSYAHVFEPTSMDEGGQKKYSVSILIPKSDKALLARVNAAIEKAVTDNLGVWGGKRPKKLKLPLRDGDIERDDEVYAGHFFIGAASVTKPGIVDADLQPLMSEDDFYSGCFGRASVNFYAFNKAGNQGIAVGLNNLQKLEDGERLSGGSSAQEDFGKDEEDDLM